MSTIGPWVDEDGVRHDPLGEALRAAFPRVVDLTDFIEEATAHPIPPSEVNAEKVEDSRD